MLFVGCQEVTYTHQVDVVLSWEAGDNEVNWSQEIPRRLESRMKGLVTAVKMATSDDGEGELTFLAKDSVSDDLILSLITTPGNLAFYDTHNSEELLPVFEYLLELREREDEALKVEAEQFFEVFSPSYSGRGSLDLGRGHVKDTATVMRMFKELSVYKEIRKLHLTSEFSWGLVDPETQTVSLYALHLNRDRKPGIYGDIVEKANYERSQWGDEWVINMEFNELASRKWEQMTKNSFENRSAIAIMIDNQIYSAPLASAVITGGRTQITSGFEQEEVRFLSAILGSGPLPTIEILRYERQIVN